MEETSSDESPDDICASTSIGGRVVIVGVCAAGKTTLRDGLRALDYDAHTCAQEHSYVHDLWRRRCVPDALVFLDVSFENIQRRRDIVYHASTIDAERKRLQHAREHCDIFVDTDELSISQVRQRVMHELDKLGIIPRSTSLRAADTC